MKGKAYNACVQCVMTYGSETLSMRAEDMRGLERAVKIMIRWICRVALGNGKTSEEIRNRLGIVCVSDLMRQGRLSLDALGM